MQDLQRPVSLLNNNTSEMCPKLGLASDPETRYSFAHWENYCYRVKPARSISDDHQEQICLTSKHTQCPVYTAEGKITFPSEYEGEGLASKKKGPLIWWLAGLLIIATMITFFICPKCFSELSSFIEPLQQSTPTVALTEINGQVTPSPTMEVDKATAIPTLSPTPTITPTNTMTPTITFTPGPDIGTPFGGGNQFMLYHVSQGDSVWELVHEYDTSYEAIRKASNLREGREIWPGDLLVIPIGQADPKDTPRFLSLYLEYDTNISVLAAKYSVFVYEIRLYNGLGNEEIIPGNRWLIIPAGEE